ncbi:hypothetical protein HanXRQr2_Chr03g0119101 [Helianthus annuus]|uniref:Uncharacterized protein n=1 Tax=Helianthus annuus TaxID=4232 RepID=A0A9K3NVS8_HELAN|nr:hypothetical protein HanXRQr2_Chr03g0119101 [Helianthus annuus]KAJ0944358.1 hypothetical protein HanPSC8_Chr03g0115691 [Helianthus annuus]
MTSKQHHPPLYLHPRHHPRHPQPCHHPHHQCYRHHPYSQHEKSSRFDQNLLTHHLPSHPFQSSTPDLQAGLNSIRDHLHLELFLHDVAQHHRYQ